MDFRVIDDIDPYIPTISQYFRSFYEKEPWGDYKGCDHCYGSLPLKDAPRFSENEVHCQQCQRPLNPFWSEHRCKAALHNTNLFTGLFIADALKGWIIAKPISETILAIDYMGLDSQFRRRKPALILMKEAIQVVSLFAMKKYCPFLNNWSKQKIMQIPIVSLQLYNFFEEQALIRGYKTIQSTTHKQAKNIYHALRSVGFHLTEKNLPNDRVLFVKHLAFG